MTLRNLWKFFWCPSRWYCWRARRVECGICGCYLNRMKPVKYEGN